jgi:ferredoxin
MSTPVYWFSGSGNSLWAAKTLAGTLHDAEAIPIARAIDSPRAQDDRRVVLVFPVYAFGPPEMVERFIRDHLPIAPGGEATVVATCGGMGGSVLTLTERLLAGRNATLRAGYILTMPDNYPPFGGAPVEAKQRKRNDRAREQLEKIIAELKAPSGGRVARTFFLFRWLGGWVHGMFMKRVAGADAKFHADASCTSCGLCARICPAGDIEIVDGRPRWLGRCQQCYACFHWCPEEAIQFGQKTSDQVRYHHPETTSDEMIVRE